MARRFDAAETPVEQGSRPQAIAITPNAAIVGAGSRDVVPIHTATGKAGKAIKGLGGPIAITGNGKFVCAVSGSHSVTPINTATNRAGKAIKVENFPVAIAITP